MGRTFFSKKSDLVVSGAAAAVVGSTPKGVAMAAKRQSLESGAFTGKGYDGRSGLLAFYLHLYGLRPEGFLWSN